VQHFNTLTDCLCFQAALAQKYGCRGLIIYSDPEEYAPRNGPPPFPEGVSLPDTGLQRGTLHTGVGDILTPDLPAIGISFVTTYLLSSVTCI